MFTKAATKVEQNPKCSCQHPKFESTLKKSLLMPPICMSHWLWLKGSEILRESKVFGASVFTYKSNKCLEHWCQEKTCKIWFHPMIYTDEKSLTKTRSYLNERQNKINAKFSGLKFTIYKRDYIATDPSYVAPHLVTKFPESKIASLFNKISLIIKVYRYTVKMWFLHRAPCGIQQGAVLGS